MKKICFFLFLGSVFIAQISQAQMHGVIMVAKGPSTIKNAKGSQPGKVGLKVFEGDSIVTGADARVRVVMQDRNVININPDSELKIEKYTNDGQSKNVELNLLKGKTRNNVEQTYDGEKNKFLIKTPTAVAGVRGTQYVAAFNPATRVSNFTVLKGSIDVMPRGVPNAQPTRVGAGEKATFDSAQGTPKTEKVPQNEMNAVDADTMASAPPKASGGDQRAPANSDSSSSAPAGESSASTAPAATQAPPKMVSVEDTSIGMASNIRDPIANVTGPAVTAPPPTFTKAPPPPPPLDVTNAVRGTTGTGTKVIVRPQPSGP